MVRRRARFPRGRGPAGRGRRRPAALPHDPGQVSRLGAPTSSLHRELIGLRRWLHTAAPLQVHVTNEQLVYTVAGDGGRSPVVLDDAASPVRVPASGAGTVVAGSGTVGRDGVEVPVHGRAVLTG